MDDLRECYRLLEVEPGASLEDVKRSYRELVKVWHPDRFTHDAKLAQKAVEKLKRINLAYERVCAAGENANFDGTSAAEEERANHREYRQRYEEDYAYTRREPPPEPETAEPPPTPRDVWKRRLKPAGAVACALAVIALSIYFYPESEPRLLIEIPPAEAPPVIDEQPRRGDTSAGAPGARRAEKKRPAAPLPDLPPQKFFGKGSSKEEVIAAQGRPDSATDTLFRYGTSDVHFENGKVTKWRNGFPRLKIKMFAAPNLGGRTYFTVGSTKDQVVDAQGTPDSFTETSFTYGSSKVFFEGGRVKSWRIREPRLNARMLPKSGPGIAAYFTIGSSKDEVLAAQGTPDAFTESEFDYGSSRVYFKKGRVVSWDSKHPTLRVKPSG